MGNRSVLDEIDLQILCIWNQTLYFNQM